jgi:hypothetical protein
MTKHAAHFNYVLPTRQQFGREEMSCLMRVANVYVRRLLYRVPFIQKYRTE